MRRTFQHRTAVWAILACGAIALCACDEPTGSQRALRVLTAAGDAQTDTVGAVLAQALVAEVTDHRGEPVAGRTVEFAVISGGGSLQPATAQTDAQGRAQAQWTLGTRTSDAQRVEARVAQAPGGSVPDTFAATLRPGAAVRMEAVSPLRLSGIQGRPLADSVAVRIFDRFDNPAQGRSVQWSAQDASPGVTSARTDGTARTQWTLSRRDDEQRLHASVVGDGSRSIDFAATGSRRTLDVLVELPNPVAYGDTMYVVVDTRASVNEATGVTVSMDSLSMALGFEDGRWRGTLVLSGLVPGPKVLQAVGMDGAGNADTAQVSILYDPPPVLILEEPANWLVVGSYRVQAACRDDEPCTFTVSFGDAVVAQAHGFIDQTFSIPAGFAASVRLRLRTEDHRGRVRSAERQLYAINEPRWTLVARLPAPPAGDVVDMDATRLLLRNRALVERATGVLTQVEFPESAFLTPHGAIGVWQGREVWERRDGRVSTVGYSGYIRVAGRWAAWRQHVGDSFTGTFVRDLESGTMRELERGYEGNVPGGGLDVATNGDVVEMNSHRQLVRYRNGIRTVLVPSIPGYLPERVRTDGNIVAYLQRGRDYEMELHIIDGAGVDRVIASSTVP
jgi:hypothetical protein